MKHLQLVLIFIFGILLSFPLITSSQTKIGQPDTPGADSTWKKGKELFVKNCSGCHGEKGQGEVGPNLTDKYWLHGGAIKNIHSSIEGGISGKGMISWTDVFSKQEMREISAYILSLRGTTPPKAKKPEGELYEEQKKGEKGTEEKQN